MYFNGLFELVLNKVTFVNSLPDDGVTVTAKHVGAELVYTKRTSAQSIYSNVRLCVPTRG